MKRIRLNPRRELATPALAVLAAAALFAVLGTLSVKVASAAEPAVALVVVDISIVAQGYRASKLRGSKVVNDQKENIGTLDDLIVGKDKVLFAILEVGGFLGLGGHLVAVPYGSLTIGDDGKRIELPGATKAGLKALAEFHYRP